MKNARFSLPFTEVIKIARLTSPLPDVLRLSSPRPRLRHGRLLALFSRPNLTLNLYTLSFTLLLVLFPHFPSLLTSLTVLLPRNRLLSMPLTWDPTFLSLSQRPCVAEPEATFLSSAEPLVLWSPTRPSVHPSPPLNFLRLPPNLSSSTATGPDKAAYPMLKHLPRSGMDFLLYIFNVSWTLHFFLSIWKTSSIILIHKMGKSLDSPASLRPISVASCVSLFECILLSRLLFFPKSDSTLSLPARPVSILDSLL